MLSNKASAQMYSNLFTKLFKRQKIKLSDETKKIVMQISCDIYYEKTLRIMHMVKRNGGWNFRNPTKRGNLDSARATIHKVPKKAMKHSFALSSVLSVITSSAVEQKVDLVATFV